MNPLRLPCDVNARVQLLESLALPGWRARFPAGVAGVVVARDLEERGRGEPAIAWRLVVFAFQGAGHIAWIRLEELAELEEDAHGT